MIYIIKFKVYIFFFLAIIIELSILYYLCAFCSVYKSSQWNWFYNSFLSVGISLLTSLGISVVVTITRYFGFWVKSEKIYNISLYLNR